MDAYNTDRSVAKRNQVLLGNYESFNAAFFAASSEFNSAGRVVNDINEAKFEALRTSVLRSTGGAVDLGGLSYVSSYSDKDAIKKYFSRLESSLTNTQNRLNISSAASQALFNPQTEPFVFSLRNLSASYPGPARFYNANGLSPTAVPKDIVTGRWVFPVPPPDFNVSVPGSPNVVTTFSGQTYTHAGNIEMEEISFSSFFPYLVDATFEARQKALVQSNSSARVSAWPEYIPDYVRGQTGESGDKGAGYHTPSQWVQQLTTALRSNQPLEFAVYAINTWGGNLADGSQLVVEPTPVSVAAFDWKLGGIGGDRRDVEFNITLKRWKSQKMEGSNFKPNPTTSGSVGNSGVTPGGNATGTGSQRDPAPPVRLAYTKENDTLTSISQRMLGDGRRWREILNLNKSKLSQTRNEKLPAGIKLSIPRT